MSDFQNPIQPPDKINPEGNIVSPIEKDKKGKETYDKLPGKQKNLLYASTMLFLKKLFGKDPKQMGTPERERLIREDLSSLKGLFNELKVHNKSKDARFASKCSTAYERLLEHAAHLDAKATLNLTKLMQLIHDIDQYPPGEEHSLGFYLKAHAGQDWLPFPFMEILERLHNKPQDIDHFLSLCKAANSS